MASNFQRPTLRELKERSWTALVGKVTGLYDWVRQTVEEGFSEAIAGVSHGLHGHASWLVDQYFPQFAEEASLLRDGERIGVPRLGAVAASGFGTVTGAGGDLAEGVLLTRADGWTYEIAASYVGLTPPATVAIRAADGYEGLEGDLAAGQTLSFASLQAGFNTSVTINSGGIANGAPVEDLELYRERVLEHTATPVMGGAPGNHRLWALEVPGVTRAWEYRGKDGRGNAAFGRVGILFVCDDDEVIIPDSTKREEVRAYVQERSTAEIIVGELVGVELDYEFESLVPNTAAVQASIQSEVRAMLRNEAEPGKRISLSVIDEAISLADGEISHELAEPTEDLLPEFAEIVIHGTATFPS